jgi:hypothetical protein
MGTNIGMMAGRRTYRAANSSIFITAANKTTLSGDTRDLVRHRDEVWRRGNVLQEMAFTKALRVHRG